ncbi:hypothetical protein ACNQQN_00055 [Mycobacteroides chelonae]|uniref:hypothetical protein n=1 Tax=Mycobacteroides chelonae TaxID=1774 RepID=UPI003AAEA164
MRTGPAAWVQLRPALVELKGHGGIVDGELSWAELTVHHTADANGDAFEVVDASADDVTKTFTIDSGVTEYTVTAGADTTVAITTKTATALHNALRALASVQALPSPGVTVTGPSGGPLVAVFTARSPRSRRPAPAAPSASRRPKHPPRTRTDSRAGAGLHLQRVGPLLT